jgi:hypothetical protein
VLRLQERHPDLGRIDAGHRGAGHLDGRRRAFDALAVRHTQSMRRFDVRTPGVRQRLLIRRTSHQQERTWRGRVRQVLGRPLERKAGTEVVAEVGADGAGPFSFTRRTAGEEGGGRSSATYSRISDVRVVVLNIDRSVAGLTDILQCCRQVRNAGEYDHDVCALGQGGVIRSWNLKSGIMSHRLELLTPGLVKPAVVLAADGYTNSLPAHTAQWLG